jgi:hypothetical protein
MARRLAGLAAAIAVALVASACNEAPPTAPRADGPAFVKALPASACAFSGNPSLSNASNAYFTQAADQKTAADFITAMQTAFGTTSNYVATRPDGFKLLSLVGKVSRPPITGSSAAAGGQVIRQAVQCMFDILGTDAALFPGWDVANNPQWDFASALTSSSGGASYVRLKTDATATPVIAHDVNGNVSGIAPLESSKLWSDILSNDVLIYGNSVPDGYDWKLIPNTTSFNVAVVALCQATSSTDMVHQEGVGVLGFKGIRAQEVCATTPPPSAFRLERGPLSRVAQFAARLFAPTLLQATTVSSVVGGAATNAKGDEFTTLDLPNVVLTMGTPSGPPKINTRFSLTVNVATPDGEKAGGIVVQLSTMTNNGANTGIFQVGTNAPPPPAPILCDPAQPYISTPSVTTLATVAAPGELPQPTNAVWDNNLCYRNTGSQFIVANSFADGNSGQGIGQAISAKINVKP